MSQTARDLSFLTPVHEVVSRVDLNTFVEYLHNTARFVEASIGTAVPAMQLGVALVPKCIPIFDVQMRAHPEIERRIRADLTANLRIVAAPSVSGVVAFAHRVAMGSNPGEPSLREPFGSFVTSRHKHT